MDGSTALAILDKKINSVESTVQSVTLGSDKKSIVITTVDGVSFSVSIPNAVDNPTLLNKFTVVNGEVYYDGKRIAEYAEILTTTSQLTNDSGYVISSDVPTKVSELTNDSSYVTTTEMNNAIANAQLGGGDGGEIDLSNYQQTIDSGLNTTSKEVVGAINEINSKMGELTIYTDLAQLKLTNGITTTAIFNTMPNNSMLRLEVNSNTEVTDIPANNSGILMIDKVSSNNVTIEYKITGGELYIGLLTIGDTTTLSWKRLCSTKEDNYDSGYIWITKYMPTGATGKSFFLSYSIRNGICFVNCGGSLTTSATFVNGEKIDLSKTTWSQSTGKTIFPKHSSFVATKLYSEKNNTGSLLLLSITANGEIYLTHSGDLITDGSDYWHGSLAYPIAE